MLIPGRIYSASSYNFGFDAQEKDDEISGGGNSLSAEYWEYDPRLGRRWNIDPLWFDWQSPYSCFNNNPIYYSDPEGLIGQDNNLKAPEKKYSDLPTDKNKIMRVPESEVAKNKDQGFQRTEGDGHYTVNYYHIPDAPVESGPRTTTDAGGNSVPATEGAYYAVWTWNDKTSNTTTAPEAKNAPPSKVKPEPVLKDKPPAQNNSHLNDEAIVHKPIEHKNFDLGTPFKHSAPTFMHPDQANKVLQQVADAYCNDGGQRISVFVSTNLDKGDPGPDGTGIDNLLWNRGLRVRQALIKLGVPAAAFPRNWLQFRYKAKPDVFMQVR